MVKREIGLLNSLSLPFKGVTRQILEEYGELVPEHKKVRDLLDAIDKSTSIRMSTVIAPILATPALSNSFAEASNYLTNFVITNKSLINHHRQASAAAATASQGRGSGCQGRGVGRNQGRQRRSKD